MRRASLAPSDTRARGAADPRAVEAGCREVGQTLQMHQPGVAYLRAPEVKLREVSQTLQMLQLGVALLRALRSSFERSVRFTGQGPTDVNGQRE